MPASAQNYDVFRKSLINEGWKPAPTTQGDTCFNYGVGACGIYPEAKDCSGTGVAACVMVWKRGSERKTIWTAGEVDRQITGID